MRTEHLEVLAASPIFRDLKPDDIEGILGGSLFQLKEYEKNTIIVQSGSICDHARIILEGKVAGEMMDLSGKVLKIEDMGPSKLIAPAFLYGKKRTYPVNVISIERSQIWQMHRDDFSRLLQKDLRLLDNFLNAISNRAQFLSDKIRFLSFPTLKAKLAFFFLQHAAGNEIFSLPMTHQQLSELFGVARPSLSREISLMKAEGYIESNRDMIRIVNKQGLKSLLNDE